VHHHFDAIPAFKRSNQTTGVVDEEEVKSPVLTLSKKVLDTLDEQTVIYVLCRVMGYVTDARSLAALLLSALGREPYSPNIAGYVTELLVEYVLYNYPRDAGEYLRSRMEGGDVTQTELQVIQTALEHSDAYFKARQNLPRLKEFHPPSQRVYRLQLAHWKQQIAMKQEVEQRSLLMSLFPTVPIKYGRGSFLEQEGTFTEPSKFGTFSHEMELPQGEFINPLGQIHQRIRGQSVGLRPAEDEAQNESDGKVDA
jgi:hypothetical protein